MTMLLMARNQYCNLMGQWMGLPFDLEWVEIQQRQPKVNELYRVFVESQIEKVEQPNT